MKEGDVIVSIESFFQHRPSYEWIQALDDTILYGITFNQFQNIYRKYPEFNFVGRGVGKILSIMGTTNLYALRMNTEAEKQSEFLLFNFL